MIWEAASTAPDSPGDDQAVAARIDQHFDLLRLRAEALLHQTSQVGRHGRL